MLDERIADDADGWVSAPPGCLLFVSELVCVGHFQLVAVFVTQELPAARNVRMHGLDRVVHLIESNLAALARSPGKGILRVDGMHV